MIEMKWHRHVVKPTEGSWQAVLSAGNERGQSTIEYLIVCFTLVTILITTGHIYTKVSDTMQNKYNSYSFAIAISDPPRKAFDDSVQKETGKVERIFKIFGEIENLFRNSVFPDLSEGKLPSQDDIEKFADKIKEKS